MVVLDDIFMLTTLKAMIFDNQLDLCLELTMDMGPTRGDL